MKPDQLPEQFVEKMHRSFVLSFSRDHNMIIEEFDFYQRLSPKMQTQLIEYCFVDTLKMFNHFFAFCEEGFRNEIVIQMYHRQTEPGCDIIWYGNRNCSVKFLIEGKVDIYSHDGTKFLS